VPGIAEVPVSGPASAPSPSGSGAIRGCHLLCRQWPSAPPVALRSGIFRKPADFGKSGGRKDANFERKIERPPGRENQGVVRWSLALLESEWDVQKGPDLPKLDMPECCCTQLSTKPQRTEAPCRGERRWRHGASA
jgi:hypothetical protein